MTPPKPREKGPRSYQKHGTTPLKRALKQGGTAALDGRSKEARTLDAWREALVADLGGEERISAQQLTVVDLACRTKVLLGHIDVWLLQQVRDGGGAALINQRSRKLHPVVVERQRLADGLARYMQMLGLEERAGDVYDLGAYVEERYGDPGDEGDEREEAAEG